MATKTPSLLEQSITTIIDTFHKYSTQEGHPDTLSQREFIKMVKTDLANFLKVRLGLVREKGAVCSSQGDSPSTFHQGQWGSVTRGAQS